MVGEERMIENIVFDIGGVLADFRIREFLLEKGLDGSVIKRVLKASVMNPYWGKFERGEVPEEETLQAFAAADPEIEDELRIAFTNLNGMLIMKDFAIPLVTGLKKD
jgi:putative hydrolase of the HAD superfamily